MAMRKEIRGQRIRFLNIGLGHTYQGVSSISTKSLRVGATESPHYWEDCFTQFGIVHEAIAKIAGLDTLTFQDYKGTRLVILVADYGEVGVKAGEPWEGSDVPKEHAIIGLGPVTLTLAIG